MWPINRLILLHLQQHSQHADALAQSCADLIGTPLNDVLGQPSPDVIDASTCAAVEAAMLSVEMRQNPAEKCDYQPLLQPDDATPDLCPAGSGPVADFLETWEGVSELPSGWEFTENLTGDTSEGVEWEVIGDLPLARGGQAVFVANTFGGSCTPGGDISGSFQLDSPQITVSANDSKLSMSHLMQSEFGFDGGNIKASTVARVFAIHGKAIETVKIRKIKGSLFLGPSKHTIDGTSHFARLGR